MIIDLTGELGLTIKSTRSTNIADFHYIDLNIKEPPPPTHPPGVVQDKNVPLGLYLSHTYVLHGGRNSLWGIIMTGTGFMILASSIYKAWGWGRGVNQSVDVFWTPQKKWMMLILNTPTHITSTLVGIKLHLNLLCTYCLEYTCVWFRPCVQIQVLITKSSESLTTKYR